LNELSKVNLFPLTVIDFVSSVLVVHLVKIEDGENLSEVRNEGFSNRISAGNESLNDFESNSDDLWVSGVESSFDGDDELRNDREDLLSALL
jgi:hypothetical protein